MILEIAQASDNQRLIEFYKNFSSLGLVELKVNREPNFFKPYEIQSPDFRTYVMREEDNTQIQGLASFIIKDVWLNNQVSKIAFGRDLRISSHRKAILSWGNHFLPVMKEIQNQFQFEYFFSVLSMSEAKALNVFVRPRFSKRALPRYFLFRRFNLVSLHGQFPWASNPLPHLRIRRGGSHNIDALVEYIVNKSKKKDLATVWDRKTFEDKISRWQGLKLEDFLIAYDGSDRIIGCVAPWSAAQVQEFIPLKYSLLAHNFRQFLKLGNLLGWARTLTKPVPRLEVEAGLNFRYLNFLLADNEDIFESLLYAAYFEAEQNEFLVYTQMRNDLHLRRPLNWISARLPHSLYCLVPPDQEAPEFLRPTNERSVELEPFFV